MNADRAREIADVCRMLADPTRVSMLAALTTGSKSVGDLCDKLKLPQPTASHHLALLRATSLVKRKRKGKQMLYSGNNERLIAVAKFLDTLR